eukprot:jgi/Ulvmu1/10392/UM061_0076.1
MASLPCEADPQQDLKESEARPSSTCMTPGPAPRCAAMPALATSNCYNTAVAPLDASSPLGSPMLCPYADGVFADRTTHDSRTALLQPPNEGRSCMEADIDQTLSKAHALNVHGGCSCMEADMPAMTGVQPKSWTIDGGLRCSYAAADRMGRDVQRSHQLPTLQFLGCDAAAPDAMEKVSAWLDPHPGHRDGPAHRPRDDNGGCSSSSLPQEDGLKRNARSRLGAGMLMPAAHTAEADGSSAAAAGGGRSSGHVAHGRHAGALKEECVRHMQLWQQAEPFADTPDRGIAAHVGLRREACSAAGQPENTDAGAVPPMTERGVGRPAATALVREPGRRAAGKDISNQKQNSQRTGAGAHHTTGVQYFVTSTGQKVVTAEPRRYGKPVNREQKRSDAWRRLLQDRGVLEDGAAAADEMQLLHALSLVAEHHHNVFRLRRVVSVWQKWAKGDAALAVAVVDRSARILAGSRLQRMLTAWRGAVVALVAEREAEEFCRQREREAQREVLAARFNRLRLLHPVLHSWAAVSAVAVAARAEAAAAAEVEAAAREKRMAIAAQFHVHCRRHGVLRGWRAAAIAGHAEREEQQRQQQLTSRIDAVLSRVRAAQRAGTMRSSAAPSAPQPQAATGRGAAAGSRAASPAATARLATAGKAHRQPAPVPPRPRPQTPSSRGGSKQASVPPRPRRTDSAGPSRRLHAVETQPMQEHSQTGATAAGTRRLATAPQSADTHAGAGQGRGQGRGSAAAVNTIDDDSRAWASIESACGGRGVVVAAELDVSGGNALETAVRCGGARRQPDFRPHGHALAGSAVAASSDTAFADARVGPHGHSPSSADLRGQVCARPCGAGWDQPSPAAAVSDADSACASSDLRGLAIDRSGEQAQVDPGQSAHVPATQRHTEAKPDILPPPARISVPNGALDYPCDDVRSCASEAEMPPAGHATAATTANTAAAPLSAVSKAEAVTRSWDSYVDFLKQEVISRPEDAELEPADAPLPTPAASQPAKAMLPVQKFSRLRGREAQEELDAQLARVEAAQGAARKKAEEERRRQVAEMLRAEWQVAKEHHALACQWHYGWRPWKLAVARSQRSLSAANTMRLRSFGGRALAALRLNARRPAMAIVIDELERFVAVKHRVAAGRRRRACYAWMRLAAAVRWRKVKVSIAYWQSWRAYVTRARECAALAWQRCVRLRQRRAFGLWKDAYLQALDQQLVFEAMMEDTAQRHADRGLLRRAACAWKAEAAVVAEERARSDRRTQMWGKINSWLDELKDSGRGTNDGAGAAVDQSRQGPQRGSTVGGQVVSPERHGVTADAWDAAEGLGIGFGAVRVDGGLTAALAAELDELLNEEELPQLEIDKVLEHVWQGGGSRWPEDGEPMDAAVGRGAPRRQHAAAQEGCVASEQAAVEDRSLCGSVATAGLELEQGRGAAAANAAGSADGSVSDSLMVAPASNASELCGAVEGSAGVRAGSGGKTIREKLAGFVMRRGEGGGRGATGRGSAQRESRRRGRNCPETTCSGSSSMAGHSEKSGTSLDAGTGRRGAVPNAFPSDMHI